MQQGNQQQDPKQPCTGIAGAIQDFTGGVGGIASETTCFLGDLLEKVITSGSTDYRHYIYAAGTKVAVYSRTTGGVNTVHYLREDHQGSVAAIINSDGTPYVKESFTAFGARRNACTFAAGLAATASMGCSGP